MKIAIVGAGGLVGTRLIEHFQLASDAPVTVTAVVRRPEGLALPARFAMETYIADSLDIDTMARAFSGCTAAIHCATGDAALTERMPAAFCMAASAGGVRRAIYLSSASVHGPDPRAGTDERSALHAGATGEMDAARIRAEQKFFAECERHSLVGFALRPGIIYGPRSRWIAEFASDLVDGRAWLYEGGRGIFNGIYVDNLVAAITGCLHATDDAAGPYLVGDAEPVTWEPFYRAAALQLDVPWSSVHQLSQLPEFKPSLQDRAGRAAAHPFVQRLLPLVPYGLKRSAKAAIAAASPAPRREPWSIPGGPEPRITHEMALLQQCAWKLPHTRAEQNLDYRPVVAFAEALERSLAWWRFARGEYSFAA